VSATLIAPHRNNLIYFSYLLTKICCKQHFEGGSIQYFMSRVSISDRSETTGTPTIQDSKIHHWCGGAKAREPNERCKTA